MNTKVELQIKNATCQAYQRYAYMEIAGQCDEDVDLFEVNNYINLRCNRVNEDNHEIDYVFLNEKYYWELPYLDTRWLLLERVRYPVCGIIKDLIDDGRYVIFDGADDYYIEARNQHQQERIHQYHDGLIYGYDDIEDTFSLLIYAEDVLETYIVPQKSIYLAVNSEYRNPEGFIVGAKKKEQIDLQFDPEMVCKGIRSYLMPEKSDNKYVYGIETGYELEKHIRSSSDKTLDLRALRLFWEHKVLMNKRLEYLVAAGLVQSEISLEYADIVKSTNVARALQTKYFVLKDNRILNKIADKILGIIEMEKSILEKIIV